MSDHHENVVRRAIEEVWNQGKFELVDALFTSDHVNHDPVNPGRGLEAVRENARKYRTAFPDVRIAVDEIFSSGDRVVLRFTYSGTQRGPLEGIAPTGRKATGTGIGIYKLFGDRIRESFVNWDALGLMQQLGVVTLPGQAKAAGA